MIPMVEHLATTWTSIDALCASLGEADWKQPTGCPGWTVQDNLSHLVDYEAFALGRERPDHVVADLSHTKNVMGESNEVGVDARRIRSGREVLGEFREVTAERLERLEQLTEEDLDREAQTPIGPGTVRDLLTLRVMDTWSHEQDIRRALGRPGHTEGPVVAHSIGYFCRFLPYVVGKAAAAPEGSTAVVLVGDLPPVAIDVVGGKARLAAEVPVDPTVLLRTDVTNFAALVGGRSDARPDEVTIAGDIDLGRRIVAALGFMP